MNKRIYLAVLITALVLFGCVELPSDKGLTFGAINIPESPSDLGQTCKLQAGQEEPWVISDNQVCTGGVIQMNGQTIRITETGSLTLNGVSIDMDGGALEIFGDLNISQSSLISGESYIFYGHDGSNIFIDNSQILNAGSQSSSYLPHKGIYVEGLSTTLTITNSMINSGKADYGIILKEVENFNIHNTDFSNYMESAIYTVSSTGTIEKNQITGGKYGINAVYFKEYEGDYTLNILDNNIYGANTAIYIDPPSCGNGECETSTCEGDNTLDCSVLNETECNTNKGYGCTWKNSCMGEVIDCSRFNANENVCIDFGCTFYEAETVGDCPEDCAPPCTYNPQVCNYEGCQYVNDKGECFADENCNKCVEQICNDLIDNDNDGLTDCDDPDCEGNAECAPQTPACSGNQVSSCATNVQPGPNSCSNYYQNVNGVFTQCAYDEQQKICYAVTECSYEEPPPQTPECTGQPVNTCVDLKNLNDPSKECANYYQTLNGYQQCGFNEQKVECYAVTECSYEEPQQIETDCSDGIDNDGDGLTDCDDPDCEGNAECAPQTPECTGNQIPSCANVQPGPNSCSNYYQNVNGVFTQCAYNEQQRICYAVTECSYEEPPPQTPACSGNPVDSCQGLTGDVCISSFQSGDTNYQCDLTSAGVCYASEECTYEEPQQIETDCSDGIDNDNDGLTDCGDADCGNEPLCIVLMPPQNKPKGIPSFNFIISENTISNSQFGIHFSGFNQVQPSVQITENTLCENVNTPFIDAEGYAFSNNICDLGEQYCSETCPVKEPVCGDGKCEGEEDYNNCPQDCEAPEQPKDWQLAEQCINSIYTSSKFNLEQCNNDLECIQLVKENMELEIINCKEQYAPENIYKPNNQIICGDGICNYPKEDSKNCPQDCKEKINIVISLVDENGLKKYEQKEIDYSKAIEERSQTGEMTLTISEENKVCTPNEVCTIGFIVGNNYDQGTYVKLRLEIDSGDANILESIDMKIYGLNEEGTSTENEISTKDISSTNGKLHYNFGGTEAVTGILVPAQSSILVNFEILPKNGAFKYSAYLDSERGDQIYIDPWVISPPIYINENYELETDLEVNGTLFIINASDVTLDCAGHTITGNGTGYGVHNDGYDNVTIRNCIITNFVGGIYFKNADLGLIENSTANSNWIYGIHFQSSSSNTLTSNIASNNSNGIYLDFSPDNNLTNNTFSNNGHGIYLSSSSHNTLENNNISNNAAGIRHDSSSNNTIIGNNANSNDNYGIRLSSSSHNTLENNTANENEYGIYLLSSSNNDLTKSNACGNLITDLYDELDDNTWFNSTYDTSDPDNRTYFGWIAGCEAEPTCVEPTNGMTITEDTVLCSGVYNLEEGITIGANDITVTCDGTVLNGTGSSNGIFLGSRAGVDILGCTITNYANGIRLWDSSFNNIYNLNVSQNSQYGISLSSSVFNNINNNTVVNNMVNGIHMDLVSNNNIISNNNIFNHKNNGISLDFVSNNTFTNNTACSNNLDLFDDGANTWFNSTYDTSDPDNRTYFGWIAGCEKETPECTGELKTCASVLTENDCTGFQFYQDAYYTCEWDAGKCIYSQTECLYDAPPECAFSALCSDCELCDGLSFNCGSYDVEETCNARLGCFWGDAGKGFSCLGEPTPCTEFDSEVCDTQNGCYVGGYTTNEGETCYQDNECSVECEIPPECVFSELCADCEICAGEPMNCDKFGDTPEECEIQLGCELIQESVCVLGVDCGSYGEENACTKGGCCAWVDVKGDWQCVQDMDCGVYENGQQCSSNPCCAWTLGTPVCGGTPVPCSERAVGDCLEYSGCVVGGYTNDDAVTCNSDDECSIECETEEEEIICEENSVCLIRSCTGDCEDFVFEDACGNGTCTGEDYDISTFCGIGGLTQTQCSELAIQNLVYAYGDGICVLLYHSQSSMFPNEFSEYCTSIGGEREITKQGETLTAFTCECEVAQACDGYRICNTGQGPNEEFCGPGTCDGTVYSTTYYCQVPVFSSEECVDSVSNPNISIIYPYYSEGEFCVIANYEGSGVSENQFQQDCALIGAVSPLPSSANMTTCDCSVDCSDPANIDEPECCFDPTDNETFFERADLINNILYLKSPVRLCSGTFDLPAVDDWYYDAFGNPNSPNGQGFAIIIDTEGVSLYGPKEGTAIIQGDNAGVGIWMHGDDTKVDGQNNLIIQNYATAILAETRPITPEKFNILNLEINNVLKGILVRPNPRIFSSSELTTYGNIYNLNINGECSIGIKYDSAVFNQQIVGYTKGIVQDTHIQCDTPIISFNAQLENVILKATNKVEEQEQAILVIKQKDRNAEDISDKLQYTSVIIKVDPRNVPADGSKYISYEEAVDFIASQNTGVSLSFKDKETGNYGVAIKGDLVNISKDIAMSDLYFDEKFVSINSQNIPEYLVNPIEVTFELPDGANCSNFVIYKSDLHVSNRAEVLASQNKTVVIRNGQSLIDYIKIISCTDPILPGPAGNDIQFGEIVFNVLNGSWSSYTVGLEENPEILDISITPSEPTVDDDLVCSVTMFDSEQENLLLTYWWTKDGSRGLAGDYGNEGMKVCPINEECELSTVSSEDTNIDEEWECFAYADDGEHLSSTESVSVIISPYGVNATETNCTDGIDNDGDGLIDCCDTEDCSCPSGQTCNMNTCICEKSSSGGGRTDPNPNLEIDTLGDYCVDEEITFIITDEDSNLIQTAKIAESKVGLGTLGYTNSIGQYRHIFTERGNYRIDATKSGYDTTYQYITISDCTGYCTNNNDCLTGYYCNGVECIELECLPGFVVSGHSCVAPKECETNGDCKYDEYCSDDGYCDLVLCTCGYIEDHECIEYECCSDIDCEAPLDLCIDHVCSTVGDDIIEQTEGSKDESAIGRFETKLFDMKVQLGELYILIEEARISGKDITDAQDLLDQARQYTLKGDFENANLAIQKAKSQVVEGEKETRIVYLALLLILLLISMMIWHNKTKKESKPNKTIKKKTVTKKKTTKKKTRKKK